MSDSVWQILKYDANYEINTEYPYSIRRIGKTKPQAEWIDSNGYYTLKISGKNIRKHRIIANQFIENDSPETKIHVDHIDRNKLNNNIVNLRWCTNKENSQNKDKLVHQKNEYLDELPEDAELIEEYNGHQFDRYFYDIWDEKILMITKSDKIKVVKPYAHGNMSVVGFFDTRNIRRYISYNKLIEYLRNLY